MTFDPDAAARPDAGIFGLDSTPSTAKVVLVPVPFEATVSYGDGTGWRVTRDAGVAAARCDRPGGSGEGRAGVR